MFQCIRVNRDVYCHVVGLGLGVWQVSLLLTLHTLTGRSSFMKSQLCAHTCSLQIHPAQNALFLEAWARALRNLQLTKVCKKFENSFAFIASFLIQKVTDLDFSWVSPCPDEVPDLAKGSQAPGSNVTINFSRRSVVMNLRQFSFFLNLF